MKNVLTMLLTCAILCGCDKLTPIEGVPVNTPADGKPLPSDKATWWQPKAGVTFDWYLDDLNDGDVFSAQVVDVDAFSTTAEQVAKFHAQGKKVIAYLSVGTFEDGRPDLNLLPKEVIGKVYPEWPDEKWLDIRQLEKLKPWLNSRFRMIISKGFDGIEPDNIDGFTTTTGFPLTAADTKKYCDLLISMAHSNGLGIGQKNVPEFVDSYYKKFDWIITEDAFDQGWENQLTPYISADKPVFAVEYTDQTAQSKFSGTVCPKAKKLGFYALLKKRSLDKWNLVCQ